MTDSPTAVFVASTTAPGKGESPEWAGQWLDSVIDGNGHAPYHASGRPCT